MTQIFLAKEILTSDFNIQHTKWNRKEALSEAACGRGTWTVVQSLIGNSTNDMKP
jgi:hypothetical protein